MIILINFHDYCNKNIFTRNITVTRYQTESSSTDVLEQLRNMFQHRFVMKYLSRLDLTCVEDLVVVEKSDHRESSSSGGTVVVSY